MDYTNMSRRREWSGRIAVMAAAGLALSAAGATSSKSYIQDGLVAHWDAIENAGYGQHDNAATVWKDLVGGYDFNLTAGRSRWDANAYVPTNSTGTSASVPTEKGLTTSKYKTFEVCSSAPSGANNSQSLIGQGSRLLCWRGTGFVGRNVTQTCRVTYTAKTPYSISMDYSTTPPIYRFDGEVVEESADSGKTAIQASNGSFVIGYGVNNYGWVSKAPIHDVRLYNRALEPWEILVNANVDQIRYRGTDGSTLNWPDGLRYAEGSVQYRVTAAASAYSLRSESENKIRFDDGTPAASLTAWNPAESAGRLTPVPDANHKFYRWEGDTEGLEITPDGVVTLDARVRNLTCVFMDKDSEVRVWTGAAEDNCWTTAGNWAPAGEPGASDLLTLPAGKTAVLGTGEDTPAYYSVDCAGTLVLSNWTTRLCVTRDLHVLDGGILTCAAAVLSGEATAAASYADQTFSRVNVSCGSLTIDKGGKIDLEMKGWRGAPGTIGVRGYGPGSVANLGPAHGGHGGGNKWLDSATGALVSVPLPCDDPAAPVQPGSSGASFHNQYNSDRGSTGGGVLRIVATGTVTVNGTITANGQNASGYGAAGWNGFLSNHAHGAAGGSVYITCRDLAGAGVISADGGGGDTYDQTYPGYPAGGGCIAVYYDANMQRSEAVRGMKITAAAGHYYCRAQYNDHWEYFNPGAVGETGRANADLGTLRFTDGKLVDELLGNGLSGQLAGISPYTYAGDLSFAYGHVRFADTGTVVTVTGNLKFGGDDSRLEIGGCEARRQSVYIEVYAGNEVNRLTVGGNLTLGGVSRLDVRAAETNGVDRFGAEVTVGGTMTVGSNCFVYAWSDVLNTGSPHFEVGNLNVAAGGTFTATRRGGAGARQGAYHVYGKSTGGGNYVGGGHGGKGGRATASAGCVSDDAVRPSLVGAGGGTASSFSRGGAGGGIVQVAAANGAIRIDGTVSANGESASEYGSGGAGGTVLLEARQLLVGESGRITAKGGGISPTSIMVGGGGGGRIALYAGQPWSETLPRSRTVRSEEPFSAEAYPGEFLYLGQPPDVSGGIVSGGTVANGVPGEEGTVRYCHVNEAPGLLLLLR